MNDHLKIPTPKPKKPRVIHIKYGTDGTVLKTHIKTSLYGHLQESRDNLEETSGKSFSYTVMVRRALDLYLKGLKKMNSEELRRESYLLENLFR